MNLKFILVYVSKLVLKIIVYIIKNFRNTTFGRKKLLKLFSLNLFYFVDNNY